MRQEEGKAGRRSTQSVPLSAEGKFTPASPVGRQEREVLKESLLVLGPFFREKSNFWEQDALLRPVRISSRKFMGRGVILRTGSFVKVKNIRLVAYTNKWHKESVWKRWKGLKRSHKPQETEKR